MRMWITVLLCVGVGACAWVKLTPGGEKVRVLDAAEVTTCKELGDAIVTTTAKVAGIDRNKDQVEKELAQLARNAAADMGGDTVVAANKTEEGKRRYTVYECVGTAAK